ncbi:MAG: hypothetical protein S4CHLAM7_02970 [Chlamydiae bacterium]|nr:hypothetical protein [Chlamydiota bacterium]
MNVLDESLIKQLSFPDCLVERMDFNPKKKELIIYVQGGWLDIDAGIKFKRTVLSFSQWEKLSIRKFDSRQEKWESLKAEKAEFLTDIPEIKIFDSTVKLSGFSNSTGFWIEWCFSNVKVQIHYEEEE